METVLIRTNRPLDPQEYWQFQLPIVQFPKSKFQFGDRVAIYWEDELGDRYCEIGVIIGMEYVADCAERTSQRLIAMQEHSGITAFASKECDHNPWIVGSYDDYYKPESYFVADKTANTNKDDHISC